MTTRYVCSNCGADAFYDDGSEDPVLLCGCDHEWVENERGEWCWANPSSAKAIEAPYQSEADEWDDWVRSGKR